MEYVGEVRQAPTVHHSDLLIYFGNESTKAAIEYFNFYLGICKTSLIKYRNKIGKKETLVFSSEIFNFGSPCLHKKGRT